MVKIIHYIFVVTLIIFVGLFIVLYSGERSLRVRIRDFTKTFSAPLASSLVFKNNNIADESQEAQVLNRMSMQKNDNRYDTQNAVKSKALKTDDANVTKQIKNMTLTETKQSSDKKVKLITNATRIAQQVNNENRTIISSNVSEVKLLDKTTIEQKVPRKSFNKDSPFYGMLFRDEYGLPMKNRPKVEYYEQSKIQWHSWKSYFPDLMVNFQKLDKFNPTLNQTISTRFASVSFNRTNYILGEKFQATITSQDGKRGPKQFGGDYYRARLIQQSSSKAPDGISCKIVDNCDGTYTVTAPLLLEGPMILEVKLVNSVEAIREIVMKTEQLITWRMKFMATLESGDVVMCNVQLASNR